MPALEPACRIAPFVFPNDSLVVLDLEVVYEQKPEGELLYAEADARTVAEVPVVAVCKIRENL